MVDLTHGLTTHKPHQRDPHGYQGVGYLHVPQISSDGFQRAIAKPSHIGQAV